jgi:tripartite ATP-independent transporter DctP family solute receptor
MKVLLIRMLHPVYFARMARDLAAGRLALIALIPLASCARESGPILIRLGHVGTAGSHYDSACRRFEELVEARLPGRVEVQVYPASQLGSDKEMLTALRLGALEMQVPSSALHSVDPVLSLFDIPFLIEDRDQLRRVVNGPLGQEVRRRLRGHGFELLGFWENGFRVITNNVRPIRRPEDLQGIKLRTPNDPGRIRLFRALGASPTSMPFGELFTALRQGVVDGQENPLSQIASARLYEVQKFLSLSRHVYSPGYPVMSRSFFLSLPPDVQAVLRAVADEVGEYHRALGEERDLEFLEICRRHLEVSSIDREAFLAATAPILDDLARDFGPELLEAVQKELLHGDPGSGPFR